MNNVEASVLTAHLNGMSSEMTIVLSGIDEVDRAGAREITDEMVNRMKAAAEKVELSLIALREFVQQHRPPPTELHYQDIITEKPFREELQHVPTDAEHQPHRPPGLS